MDILERKSGFPRKKQRSDDQKIGPFLGVLFPGIFFRGHFCLAKKGQQNWALPTFVLANHNFLTKNGNKSGHLTTFCPLLKKFLASKNITIC